MGYYEMLMFINSTNTSVSHGCTGLTLIIDLQTRSATRPAPTEASIRVFFSTKVQIGRSQNHF